MASKIELKNQFKYDHSIGLVTTATELNQNLALLDTEDYFKADSMVVAHEGYLNYIPLFNSNMRRSKYVPICFGADRGKGQIRWFKWMKFGGDTYFVCLSTIGVQFYDVELTDIHFEYDFYNLNSKLSIPIGACILNDNLYVGVPTGYIAVFKNSNNYIKMMNNLRISSFYGFDGYENYLVTISSNDIKCYELKANKLILINQVGETNFSSVFKLFKKLLLVGFTNGYLLSTTLPDLKIIKSKIHDEEITALDYCDNRQFILSCSEDLFIKAWKYNIKNASLECIFSLKNDQSCCGARFSIYNGNEFCLVKSNGLNVEFFTNSEDSSSDEDLIKFAECE